MTKQRREQTILIEQPKSFVDLARARRPANASAELFDTELEDDDIGLLPGALQGVLTELGDAGGESKVTVKRVETANGVKKSVWLFECAPSEFNMADVQEAYGPGTYRIVVYGPQPGTKYKIVHADKLIVIGPTREAAAKALLPAPVAAPQGGAPELAAAVAQALAPAFTTMGEAMKLLATRGGGDRASVLAEVKELAGIAGLSRPADGGMGNFKNVLEVAGMLAGLKGGESKVPEDPDAAPYAIILKAMEMFGDGIRHAREQRAAPGAELPPAGAAAVALPGAGGAPAVKLASVPAAPAATTSEENDEMNLILRGQLAMLRVAAAANDDVEKWAGRLYDDLPEEYFATMQGPEWWNELLKLDPKFLPFKTWCEKVRAAFLEIVKEEQARDPGAHGDLTAAPDGARVPPIEADPAP
jgi:hypothetical protein